MQRRVNQTWARYLEGDEILIKIGSGWVGMGRDGSGLGRDGLSRPIPTFGMGQDGYLDLKFFREKLGKVRKSWEKLGRSWLFRTYPNLNQLFPTFLKKIPNFSWCFRPKTLGKIKENPDFPWLFISTIRIKWLSQSWWSQRFGIVFQSRSQINVRIGTAILIYLAHGWSGSQFSGTYAVCTSRWVAVQLLDRQANCSIEALGFSWPKRNKMKDNF